MDGSAGPFVSLIQSGGIREQDALKRVLRIKRKVTVEDGDKVASFLPFDGFKVSFTIDFDQPVFRDRSAHVELDFSSTTRSSRTSARLAPSVSCTKSNTCAPRAWPAAAV